MPNFDIDSFRANFKNGAKSYLFYVKPMFPTAIGANSEMATYLVKSSVLPASTIEEIPIDWQGFAFKMAGRYTFDNWEVTYNVDKDAKINQWFTDWQRLIHDPTTNIYTSPADYMVDQQVELLGNDGEPIIRYKLVGAWPSAVGEVSLEYAGTEIAMFSVTYTYQYFVIDRGASYEKPLSFAG